MHPLIACWITYVAILDAQPHAGQWCVPNKPWDDWLHLVTTWHDWFDVLRRLPEGTR